ncbi:hypothetical protein ES332_A11G255900v1 [Gossypium tomentosum]|uniref:Uncharacterized protein n=1 Tax=Gossypium tomentosum TaxID=34277 RepID=A0A5D2NDX7_GOSTO|nr:hypothetical protein ES332_A11G255900v1 [Gossypium tomentosum]
MYIVPQICGFIMKFTEVINSKGSHIDPSIAEGTFVMHFISESDPHKSQRICYREKLWSMLTADSARLVPRMWICPDDDKESGYCSGKEYDGSRIGEFRIECPKCQFEVKLMKLAMRDEI